MKDTWTKVEEAQSHLVPGTDPDEWQKVYATAVEPGDLYKIPDQESDHLSTVITATIDGVDHDLHEFFEAHPTDPRFELFETIDRARAESFGTWMIDARVPFRVVVRPILKEYAVWEFRHEV